MDLKRAVIETDISDVHTSSDQPAEKNADLQLQLFADGHQREESSAWSVVVGMAMAYFVAAFCWYGFRIYNDFGQFGFDIGIFAQGTWLLSHLQTPFVTIRGLNLFGDHSSYILLLVAPFYRIWPDPRLLILLQAIALAVPAMVLYRLGRKWISAAAGAAIAVAYLLFPAMQWAASWQFHPETLAAAFLSLAVLALNARADKRMALCLCLAAMCKEDVSLVVAGFGLMLVTLGRRRAGAVTVGASVVYFFFVTSVVVRLINGKGSLYLRQNYGIDGSGPLAILTAFPLIALHAVQKSVSETGLLYLALLLVPLMLLPVLGPRWLLPVASPIILNLASNVPYQQSIHYQYLATSSPFIAVAALAALRHFRPQGMRLVGTLVGVVLLAATMSYQHGPGRMMWDAVKAPASVDPRHQALELIPSDASVSAYYAVDATLSGRKTVYEFPNPFRGANWGLSDSTQDPRRVDTLQYVVVDPSILEERDTALVDSLRTSGQWEAIFDTPTFLILEHQIPPPS